ncbi:MAG: RnfABCDGE type electron transport complex subunit B [Firmicutes bacterium]|nr:RnfABCDGE type electron transport complex subunit B [Bacillota bacterium]
MANTVLVSLVSMGTVGALFGAGLAWASRKFAVESDARVDDIEEILPGANCGACGYPGCRGFAEAVVAGAVPCDGCPVSSSEAAALIGEVMGVTIDSNSERLVAIVHCGGGHKEAKEKADYVGITDCRAAAIVSDGSKGCEYGCLGLASCVKACPFDAMSMGPNGLPIVDEDKCTACGLCVAACPRDLISLAPVNKVVHVLCRSFGRGREVRGNCTVGCIGCRACERACEFDAIHVTDFLAEINYANCTNCGECVAKCPTNSIIIQGDQVTVAVEQTVSEQISEGARAN